MPARLNVVRTGKHLLKQDKYKDVVVESLRFLVKEKRIRLNAFVIMSNHMHLIWQPLAEFTPIDIQHSLMSFTAHQFKNDLEENHPKVLSRFKVEAKDRDYLPIAIGIGEKFFGH